MHKLLDYITDELQTLESKAGKGKLSMQELQYVDTLANVKKNLLKVETMEGGDEYSNAYSRRYDTRGYSRNEDGGSGSYARPNVGRGADAARDNYGRYSSRYSMAGGDMLDELRDMMDRAPEDKKQDFKRLIDKMERM